MIVYHGTVDTYLPSIEKSAVIPASCIVGTLKPHEKVRYWGDDDTD